MTLERHKGPIDRWTVESELMAQVADRLAVVIKVLGTAWLKDFELDLDAVRIPRPGTDYDSTGQRPARRQATAAELAAFIKRAAGGSAAGVIRYKARDARED